MRELLTRLAAGDEGASWALRILDYFDALDEPRVGPEAYLRGAAALTSLPTGMTLPARRLTIRIGPGGQRLAASRDFTPDPHWPRTDLPSTTPGVAWIEADEPGISHQLVLERVVQGITRWSARLDALVPTPTDAWSVLLNDPVPPDRRKQLLAALRLDEARSYRVVARVPTAPTSYLHTTATVRGTVVDVAVQPADVPMGYATEGRAGIGSSVRVADLLDSWERAAVCLRTARQGEVLHWDRLGVLGPLLVNADADEILRDRVVAEIASDSMPWLDQTVTAVTRAGSVRGAGDLLHLHNSTVQKRVDKLQQTFDLDLSNARHVYNLWLACAAYRFASFGDGDGAPSLTDPVG